MLPELKNIRVKRKLLGMTQVELAKSVGISQSMLAKMESGRIKPRYETVKRIFDFLERVEMERKIERRIRRIYTPNLIHASPGDRLIDVVSKMRRYKISQVPVINDKGTAIGSVSESDIVDYLDKTDDFSKATFTKVSEIMREPFPILPKSSPLSLIIDTLRHNQAILISEKGCIKGIITRSDVLKILCEG